MKQLDPKAVWLFFFNYLVGATFMMLPLYFISSTVTRAINMNLDEVTLTEESVFLSLFEITSTYLLFIYLILILIGYIWAQLTYKYYKYELSADGFKKESGIIWKSYVTIPYERIQNVDIYRGVFARLLGLSDLQIQTAGMSAIVGRGATGMGAEGRLPAISMEEAEKLRDTLVKKASKQ